VTATDSDNLKLRPGPVNFNGILAKSLRLAGCALQTRKFHEPESRQTRNLADGPGSTFAASGLGLDI
jgi:hypothetical protein